RERWNSSMSEKPVRSRLRRLVDWINLTGAKKVHSLIDKVYKRKNLEMAWEKVKANRGSGGIDGLNLAAFEVQLNQHLDRLQRELREDSYQPQPVRQHPIPKRDKPGEYRMLASPRSMIGCASKRCSIGWSPSSSRSSMMPASDIGEGDRRRTPCARSGKRYEAGRSGSWTRICETFSGLWTMRSSLRSSLSEWRTAGCYA